jgi:hypothetical protein
MKDCANNTSGRNVGSDVSWNNGVFSYSSQVFAWNGYDAINLSAKYIALNEAGKHIHKKLGDVYLLIQQLVVGIAQSI